MNFTREPVIETVITAKEGHKLVVRSSKGGTQEEFFVDAVEVISFGNSCFFRSLEKPKSFLVPVNDYEILEVREARIVLKTPGIERGIKIGGGKDTTIKASREKELVTEEIAAEGEISPPSVEQKMEKRRERRRFRKRRGKSETDQLEETDIAAEESRAPSEIRPSLIPPPQTLISETLGRRKEMEMPQNEADVSDEENAAAEDEHIPF